MRKVTHWDRKKIRLTHAQAVPQIGQQGGISGLHKVAASVVENTLLCKEI